jgi:hypothetical protein
VSAAPGPGRVADPAAPVCCPGQCSSFKLPYAAMLRLDENQRWSEYIFLYDDSPGARYCLNSDLLAG